MWQVRHDARRLPRLLEPPQGPMLRRVFELGHANPPGGDRPARPIRVTRAGPFHVGAESYGDAVTDSPTEDDALADELEELEDRFSVYRRTGETIPLAQLIDELGLGGDVATAYFPSRLTTTSSMGMPVLTAIRLRAISSIGGIRLDSVHQGRSGMTIKRVDRFGQHRLFVVYVVCTTADHKHTVRSLCPGLARVAAVRDGLWWTVRLVAEGGHRCLDGARGG
jgi:hypothetical protein